MRTLTGPWYPLNEALQLLELNRTEFLYQVSTDNIQLVANTKPRNFLMFKRYEEGWTGCAVCHYRGHLTLHRTSILKLLDGEQMTLSNGNGRLLEEHGVLQWSPNYPFKKPLPHPPLTQWITTPKNSTPISDYSATPMPDESVSMITGITTFVKTFAKFKAYNGELQSHDTIDEEGKVSINPPGLSFGDDSNLELFFKDNSLFKPDCLRVPASEITHYKQSLLAPPIENETTRPKDRLIDGRENQLHSLIERIVEANPNITAIGAWRLIEEDCSSDEPQFDRDGILLMVDATCIEWISRHGKEQSVKWSSFQPLLTKIKKRIAAQPN